MLLYTSRTSGAGPLELSVSYRKVCYSYFRVFFFSVPVFQFMMSEYPILIKSAKGRLGSKHFKIGHQHSTEYISFAGTSCRTSGQKKTKQKQTQFRNAPLASLALSQWPRIIQRSHFQSPHPWDDAGRSHLCRHFIAWSLLVSYHHLSEHRGGWSQRAKPGLVWPREMQAWENLRGS